MTAAALNPFARFSARGLIMTGLGRRVAARDLLRCV
jgi:hypothetical protein